MTGTDLTRIDGIDVMTAMTIISEAGWDMSKWPDEDHFVSWLRLCPDNRISGNKVIGKGRLPTNNRSEERRVGKECRSRWSSYQKKKKPQQARVYARKKPHTRKWGKWSPGRSE